MKQRVFIVAAMAVMLGLAGCSKSDGQKDLEKGLRELKRENYVRAKSLLEKSIARRPGHIDNAVAHNYLGIAAWRLGQFQEAMTAFEDSRRLNPNLVEPVYNLGVLAAERDDMRNATRHLNDAANMNRQDARPLEYLAELHMQRGQWTLARNTLYAALDRDSRSPRIYNSIAVAHLGLNQVGPALEALMQALEVDTRYAAALYNLAVVYDLRKGDAEQARAFYKRFLAAAPRDARAGAAREALSRLDRQGPLGSPGAEAAMESAPVVEEATEADGGEEAAPAAMPADPVYEGLMRSAIEKAQSGRVPSALDDFVKAAEQAARERRVEDQERAYREAVRLAGDQPRAHALLGQHLLDRGLYDGAAGAFRQAAALNADYAPAQLGLGRIAMRNNEHDAALVHFRKAIASDPTLGEAQWELAVLYDQSLDLREPAAEAYRVFARQFPNDARRAAALARADELVPPPVAERVVAGGEASRLIEYEPPATRNRSAALQAFNRAGSYQEQQNWDQAIFYLLRAIENDDQLASVFYNLGICYTMKGDADLARDAYRRALRLQPDLVDASYNLALLVKEAGDAPGAIALLEGVLTLRADYAGAHYALGMIYAEKPETHAKAKQHYERFLRLAPNDRSAPAIRNWIRAYDSRFG